ncbi:MAG TPA: DUF5979 domain-containing protein [Acidimicrobiia bacterium]|nr:DUF5979 domain-containing protein [Acidimicrobiia bacterium]
MRATRGVRGIVASMFVVGAATVGFAVNALPAGAGASGIQCHVEGGDGVVPEPVTPTQDGQVSQCAQLEVTKTVTGTPAPSPPPGTTYSVVVDCVPVERDGDMRPTDGVGAQQLPEGQSPPFTTTLTFPENGGTQSVFIDRPSDCTVTEAPPPGCTLRSIDPGTTEIRSPILYGVTVTNNCDPPVEAAAAVAVVEAPRFTG